jgi:hypothetical protein
MLRKDLADDKKNSLYQFPHLNLIKMTDEQFKQIIAVLKQIESNTNSTASNTSTTNVRDLDDIFDKLVDIKTALQK